MSATTTKPAPEPVDNQLSHDESAEPIVRVRDLSTRFKKQWIHQHLDLDVRDGEILALVGASGSGKTTLLRQIIGLERPNSGAVEVFGINIHQAAYSSREFRRRLRSRWGVLFQHGALFSALSVFDNIAFPLRELKMLQEPMIKRLVMLKLTMVGLDAPLVADQMPSELSGGMVKRVALARALATEPDLLLLDEPTSGLDPVSSEQFVALLKQLQMQLGLTTIMVTHDLDTIADLCDRVAVLSDKKVAAIGKPSEVAKIELDFVQDFFNGHRGRRTFSGTAVSAR